MNLRIGTVLVWGGVGQLLLLSDSLPVGVPSPNVCCKCVIIHKANTEMNKLAGRKRLRRDYVGESYGIFATHLAEDNTNSSLRIESLHDSSHVAPLY